MSGVVEELRIIAAEVHQRRPDWDLQGVLTILAKERDRTDPTTGARVTIEQIRAAAIKASRNGRWYSPAVISDPSSWADVGHQPDGGGPPGYRPLPECAACRHPVRRDQAEKLTQCPHCRVAPFVAHVEDPVGALVGAPPVDQLVLGEEATPIPPQTSRAQAIADTRAQLQAQRRRRRIGEPTNYEMTVDAEEARDRELYP